MSINLGLERVYKLLDVLGKPNRSLKVFHVGGTNGKGSTCAYLSSILACSNLSVGRFTSPHLIEPRDSIFLNNREISKPLYEDALSTVLRANGENQIGASNFEVLSATALEVFYRKQVDVGVIEVGLGGTLDATNVPYKHVLASLITKIGIDHQSILGNSLADIALQKAGIMRTNSACIVDGSNDPEVVQVLSDYAKHTNVSQFTIVDPKLFKTDPISRKVQVETRSYGDVNLSATPLHGEYQHQNLALAIKALDSVSHILDSVTARSIKDGIEAVQWPGRLQFVNFVDNKTHILVDGAHNQQAARELQKFVATHLRQLNKHITWIIALSGDRNPEDILPILLEPGDVFYAATFDDVEQMPWIKPKSRDELCFTASQIVDNVFRGDDSITKVIKTAAEHSNPIVVAGSLYLVSEVMKASRNVN
ncbi:Mur ligase [Lipomyces oligophaga]|uniref:Mur ligase n=1 Tax=Lipomyces oligophaga TaxID=45792 RepID=UPI0034CDC1F1